MVKRQSYVPPNTTQRTAVSIEPFGTDKSVPYAHAGKCTFQRTAPKSLPFGTDLSAPKPPIIPAVRWMVFVMSF